MGAPPRQLAPAHVCNIPGWHTCERKDGWRDPGRIAEKGSHLRSPAAASEIFAECQDVVAVGALNEVEGPRDLQLRHKAGNLRPAARQALLPRLHLWPGKSHSIATSETC